MARMIVEVPDEMAARLREHPLPLPVDDYVRRSLDEAIARDTERRLTEIPAAPAPVPRPAPKDEPLFYPLPKAARMLGVSTDHLKKLIAAGRLPSLNLALGGVRSHMMVPAEAIRALANTLGDG